jgi:hypothetical protein
MVEKHFKLREEHNIWVYCEGEGGSWTVRRWCRAGGFMTTDSLLVYSALPALPPLAR